MHELDCTVVSTDDEDILRIINAIGLFGSRRPDHLCGDDATSQGLIDYTFEQYPLVDSIVLLQPTSPTRPDSLVRQLIAHGGQVRSVTNGVPNGQCYVYRKGVMGWTDIETEKGHDIDVLADFEAAEQDMMRRFA
jgi:CMP-N-acetylneuraminic acid synthetase